MKFFTMFVLLQLKKSVKRQKQEELSFGTGVLLINKDYDQAI